MAYRSAPLCDSSDSNSDNEEVFWKRRPSDTLKRKSAEDATMEEYNAFKSKRSRNNVWLNVLNECNLDEALSVAHKCDTSRGVESYLVHSGSNSDGEGANDSREQNVGREKHPKMRMPPSRFDPSISRPDIGISFDSPSELVKKTLVTLLNEPNEDLLGQVVDVLGVKRSLEFYYLTEDVERAGGLYYAHGTRRRTRGGVFLNLIKRSDEVDETEKKAAFVTSRQIRDKIKRKRKQARRRLAAGSEPTVNVPGDVKTGDDESTVAAVADEEQFGNEDESCVQETNINLLDAPEVEEGEMLSTDGETD
ncbi:unnamed protein product [Calicophoron daubneyi]|uniref:Phosphorylated adapter RNA export protein n=1 Tax=Calicophoron daubneyi TaxID=300641 RepID=A0AAV2TR42_CALDB